MLTLARAMHVGKPARVNWNGDIRTGVTSTARASVAQAAGDRDIRTAMARCGASVAKHGRQHPRVRLGHSD
ncbi:MAG: hypothetical protein H0X66_20950 [Verrucomicrobia bacterium]|nr:hypothetical protein [Verrucomicrobiota bacterium]